MVEARIPRLYIETSVYNFYFYGKEHRHGAGEPASGLADCGGEHPGGDFGV